MDRSGYRRSRAPASAGRRRPGQQTRAGRRQSRLREKGRSATASNAALHSPLPGSSHKNGVLRTRRTEPGLGCQSGLRGVQKRSAVSGTRGGWRMALRFQPRAEHDHRARWLACLALAAAGPDPPRGRVTARADPTTSDSSGMILVAPPLQVNSAGHGSVVLQRCGRSRHARAMTSITVTTPDDALPSAERVPGPAATAPCGRRSTRRPRNGATRSSSSRITTR